LDRKGHNNFCSPYTSRLKPLPAGPKTAYNPLLLQKQGALPGTVRLRLFLLLIGEGVEDVFGNVHGGLLLTIRMVSSLPDIVYRVFYQYNRRFVDARLLTFTIFRVGNSLLRRHIRTDIIKNVDYI